jgi:translation initiation factor 4A
MSSAKWDDFVTDMDVLKGIYEYGFENPSEIQQKSIPVILSKKDVIAQAQSGMGKTGAFTIGTLGVIDVTLSKTQALILAPTHELVNQTYSVVKSLGSSISGLVVKTLMGGSPINDDVESIRNQCPHIIVGSAGRVYDMFRRKYISGRDIRIMVLDEADEMLSKGFKETIYSIFQFMNTEIQVALFSATLPEEIMALTDKFMRDPVKITMEAVKLNLDCITQYYVALRNDNDKYDTLKDLFSAISVSQCIIYCNSVQRVTQLYNAMTNEGFSVCCIHSSMDKSDREREFKQFRTGAYRVMISSDLTARGIDIQQVSIVINFDITPCVHKYLHRIGRSGRWGRKGVAINFVTKYDVETVKRIERHYNINMKELPSSFSGIIC